MTREQGERGEWEQMGSESQMEVQSRYNLAKSDEEFSIFLCEVKVIGKFKQSGQI